MNILLIEPYFTGSHKSWAEGYKSHSNHTIDLLTMKGQFWKWRMHGGAVTLANQYLDSNYNPNLIITTDMLDLSTFLSLTRRKTASIPTALYFHENQLSYPWSPTDRDVIENRNKHYGFINFTSALSADYVFFNSQYHLDSFTSEATLLLKHFPDYNEIKSVQIIREKSRVLHLGLDLKRFDAHQSLYDGPPLILWNHRWEYDKNPELFFETLFRLNEDGLDFRVAVLGENFKTTPSIFDTAQDRLKNNIIYFGYCESFSEYAQWLWKADIIPVTNIQDFFGISIMEALYCNTYPLLPDRLAYPELLPEKFHKDHIYRDKTDLFDKLKECILNINEKRNNQFSQIAQPFDWNTMAPIYDNLFRDLIS
jgi:glycosyltransferase involved in cell wall biosynthesis